MFAKIMSGDHQNVSFSDLQRLSSALGFELERMSGSHHIYRHPAMKERLNLQVVRGQAKVYQVRQLRALIKEYDLSLEDEQ
ncbi:MAG: type II toxin-antitoxin system HicA family toxin [Actinomycetota bacterium]|nr:type II toxin-antitoxin system HicA family toxin [Actinomycetota bacterium]